MSEIKVTKFEGTEFQEIELTPARWVKLFKEAGLTPDDLKSAVVVVVSGPAVFPKGGGFGADLPMIIVRTRKEGEALHKQWNEIESTAKNELLQKGVVAEADEEPEDE